MGFFALGSVPGTAHFRRDSAAWNFSAGNPIIRGGPANDRSIETDLGSNCGSSQGIGTKPQTRRAAAAMAVGRGLESAGPQIVRAGRQAHVARFGRASAGRKGSSVPRDRRRGTETIDKVSAADARLLY